MRPEVTRWTKDNTALVGVIQQCFAGHGTAADSQALSAWVTDAVMRGYTLYGNRETGDAGSKDIDLDPYVCQQDDCGRRFHQASGLKVHAARSHGPGWSTKSKAARPVVAPPEEPVVPIAAIEKPAKPVAVPEYVRAVFFEEVALGKLVDLFGSDAEVAVIAGRGVGVLEPTR